MPATNNLIPIPGRNCGECTACCVALRIDTESLQKHADVPCQHLSETAGCGVYETRPPVCQEWYCGWRYMEQLGDEWRPDRSRILLKFQAGVHSGLIFQTLGLPLEVLTTPLALDLIGGCIASDFPTYISIQGNPGYCGVLLQLNTELADAVKSRDFERVKAGVIKAVDHGSRTPTNPIAPLSTNSPSTKKPGRLEPCPCGSDKRYKDCHGKL